MWDTSLELFIPQKSNKTQLEVPKKYQSYQLESMSGPEKYLSLLNNNNADICNTQTFPSFPSGGCSIIYFVHTQNSLKSGLQINCWDWIQVFARKLSSLSYSCCCLIRFGNLFWSRPPITSLPLYVIPRWIPAVIHQDSVLVISRKQICSLPQ